ncbi:hypothetical protein [Clostridium beijerinckii]|nr:hypothetical protein [Clostridium beijerinckii]
MEWSYFDFHKDRWRWIRWFALIPTFKNRFNGRIVHLKFFCGDEINGEQC